LDIKLFLKIIGYLNKDNSGNPHS